MVGIIARLECSGKLGGEGIETAHIALSKSCTEQRSREMEGDVGFSEDILVQFCSGRHS